MKVFNTIKMICSYVLLGIGTLDLFSGLHYLEELERSLTMQLIFNYTLDGIFMIAVGGYLLACTFIAKEKETKKEQASHTAMDVTEEVMKCKKLLENGAITQEEFDTIKKTLLGL